MTPDENEENNLIPIKRFFFSFRYRHADRRLPVGLQPGETRSREGDGTGGDAEERTGQNQNQVERNAARKPDYFTLICMRLTPPPHF